MFTLNPNNGADVNTCIKDFMQDDFEKCAADGSPLLFAGKCPLLTQVVLISLLRLENRPVLGLLVPRCLQELNNDPWHQALLQLSLGGKDYEEVLSLAGRDPVRICQAQYYAGERFLTDGQPYDAVDKFDTCAQLQLDCDECELASWQIWKRSGRQFKIGGKPR